MPLSLLDDVVHLPQNRSLAIRRTPIGAGDNLPFLLVHGLASNARLWDGVAGRLAAAGHPVAALDQRGHGRSAEFATPELEYTTAACVADLAEVLTALGWVDGRAPILVGQSWGANVVLTAAARLGPSRIPAIALVDGGWLALGRRFSTFADCWDQLAPPSFVGARYDDLAARLGAGTTDWPAEALPAILANLHRLPEGEVAAILPRAAHRQILESMWTNDPAELYPQVQVPTLLLPAGTAQTNPASDLVTELLAAVPRARVRWYPGAHHDLHAQRPDEVAADLLSLIKDLKS